MSWFDDIDEEIADAIVRLKVVLPNSKKIERDFRPDVDVDPDLVVEQLADIPAIYAFWSAVLAEQTANTDLIERSIKLRKALIVQDLMDQSKKMAADGAGIGTRAGLRKDDIKDLMQADDTLQKLDAAYIKSSKTRSKIWGIVKSLEIKADSLRTIAGFKKIELQNS